MIRNPEELTNAIKSAVNRRAIVFSHLILAFVITAHTVLWSSTLPYEKYLAVTLSFFLIVMIFLRFFDLASINAHPFIYTVIYEILTFVGISFLTEAATPYILVPIVTMLIANLYYGVKGVAITVAVFGLASITKLFFFDFLEELTTNNMLDIAAGFLVFLAIASLFVSIQKVYDWDRSRLKATVREATIGQKRLRTLVNNMTESVLVLDRNGIVRLYNAAALALFDTNASLEKKRPADFAQFEDEKGKAITIEDLLPRGPNPVARNDIKILYGKDDSAALSLTITPLRTSFGQGDTYTGYILTMRDITREKSLEEERNEFISVISHELRTPVTVTEASLSNALMMHDKYGGNEEVKKTIETAHDQSIFLANMLNDLATFARAEKGTLELNIEYVNPRELTEQLAIDYSNEGGVKGIEIISKVQDGTPEKIATNRLYVREILQNFITNGIKYSDSGTITIEVQPDSDSGVQFNVKDQGIGISVSDQKKVFNKFYRSEDFRTRSRSGTGLGLYIVRKLAKLLRAEITMESELGVGSTFSLKVPDLHSLMKTEAHNQPDQTTKNDHEQEVNKTPDEADELEMTDESTEELDPKAPETEPTNTVPDFEPEAPEQSVDVPVAETDVKHKPHATSYHLQKQR
jgi:two-component system phosphate regulon sensor histidine kinase PhoR